MKPEILIAIITGSISLFGVIITAWLNYKAKLLELQMKSDKPLPAKRRKNIIWFIIFGIILLGSGIYFLIQQNISNDNIVWETDTKGYFTDQRDQHRYKVVKIGEQVWMAENWGYKTNSSCWAYNNNENNVAIYGYLYDWKTAKSICPNGWYLPSDQEWKQLENYLGGQMEAQIKLKSRTGWEENNGTNESNFNALPGGYRYPSGGYNYKEYGGHWWTSTTSPEKENAIRRHLTKYKITDTYDTKDEYGFGFSIRCLKNKE